MPGQPSPRLQFSDASISQHRAVLHTMYVKHTNPSPSRVASVQCDYTLDPGSLDYFGIPCSCAEIRSVVALGERRN